MKRVNDTGGKPRIDFSEVAKNSGTKGKAATTSKKPTRKQARIIQVKQLNPELTTRQIAKIADTDHVYVIRVLRRYGLKTRRDLDLYKEHRADILAGVQGDAIETYYTLTEEQKKKLIMRRGLVDMGIAYDKERLERDLSTVNIVNVIADIEALRESKEAIRKALKV